MVNRKNIHSLRFRVSLEINITMLIVWFEIAFVEDG
jgi:hypothetical protein